MTKLEEQNASCARQNFRLYQVRYVPSLTDEDRQALMKLRDLAPQLNLKESVKKGFADCEEIGSLIRWCCARDRRELIHQAIKEAPSADATALPSDDLFRKLQALEVYDWIVTALANDGYEIYEGIAYEDDGETVKADWINLYINSRGDVFDTDLE